MSSGNYLEKLLDGAVVEWKPLGEVLVRTKGTKITAGQMRELHKEGAPVKVFAGGKTVAFVDFEDIPEKDVNREPSIIVKSRGVIEFEYYDKPFSHKSEMWSYNANGKAINIRYVYHFLKLNEPHFQNIGSKMQMPQIATPDTDKFDIPIPCPENPEKSLEIQGEIVRILDAFTELTVELTAELTARKKQYNHYRDQLLRFEDGEVEWKKLGSVTTIKTGQAVNKQMISDNPGEYAVINSGREPLGFINEWNTDNDPIGITSRGAGVGSITWQRGKYFRGNLNYSATIKNDKEINTRYLYHTLLKMQLEIQAICTFDGIPALNAGNLKELEIPIPPLVEQERIVAILDKFDALTHSLTEGLPREIELRQKQYEHYRDLLLNFPKPEEVAA